jgi:hypothetical protein
MMAMIILFVMMTCALQGMILWRIRMMMMTGVGGCDGATIDNGGRRCGERNQGCHDCGWNCNTSFATSTFMSASTCLRLVLLSFNSKDFKNRKQIKLVTNQIDSNTSSVHQQ